MSQPVTVLSTVATIASEFLTAPLLAVSCPMAFLTASLADVSTFGTSSFAALALHEGMNVHGHWLRVLSVISAALDFFPAPKVSAQSVSSVGP